LNSNRRLEKQTSGAKAQVDFMCLIVGVKTPTYHFRPTARISYPQAVETASLFSGPVHDERDHDPCHSGGGGCLDAEHGVFEDETVFRGDSELFSCEQKAIGCGLGVLVIAG
jgi:hypothetical protein